MPAYNAEQTIAGAIESVLNQSHQNLDLIIVDDASQDSTLEIAKSYMYDERVRVYKNKENMGAYYCRNYGLYVAKKEDWEFFTVHDSDDISYPERYKVMISRFKNNISAVQDMMARKDLKTKKLIKESLTMSHAVFRKEIFDGIGYFDNVRIAGDSEYWLRSRAFAYKNNMKPLSHKHVLHDAYIHGENLTVKYPVTSKKRKSYMEKADLAISKMTSASDYYKKFMPKSKVTTKTRPSKAIQSLYNDSKVAVVLLTWKRIHRLGITLNELSKQSHSNFDLIISNGNLEESGNIESIARKYRKDLNITIRHDGNDYAAFRRLFIGKELAEAGYNVVLFLDDDISIPDNYVRRALAQYEPKTYQSVYAWSFYKNARNYYTERTRQKNNLEKIHYCGSGVSMIDPTIFLDPDLANTAPTGAYDIEDLWMSYYADHVLGWKLKYLNIQDVEIAGADKFALHKKILKSKYDKSDFLNDLQNKFNWDLS